MDLDFSFALVSSLTPHSLPARTPLLSENNKLSSKSKKTKPTKIVSSQPQHKEQKEENKENHPLEEQLMIKNEFCYKSNIIAHVANSVESADSNSPHYPVDMTNVTTRTKKCNRNRRKKPSSLNSTKSGTIGHSRELSDKLSESTKQDTMCFSTIGNQINSNNYVDVKETSLESDSKITSIGPHVFKKGVKRKSAQQLHVSETSVIANDDDVDLVESSCSALKYIPLESSNRLSTNSNKSHLASPLRTSDIVETSLSTSYSSGSIRITRRQAAKVIPETPESDESLKNVSCTKKKCSFNSELSSSEKAKSSERTSETSILSLYSSSSIKVDSPQDKQSTKRCNISDKERDEKKNIRSRKCSLPKFDSSLPKPDESKKVDKSNKVSRKVDSVRNIKKVSVSPVLKEINVKSVPTKKPVLAKGKKVDNTLVIRDSTDKSEINITKKGIKKSKEKSSDKCLTYLQGTIGSIKSSFAPPSEIIPKFEHVNNWLKDTQDYPNKDSPILISSDSSFNSPEKVVKPTKQKPKTRKSLSPRVKRKLAVAQKTLLEEQQIFEDLYGSDAVKRLSDDVEENRAGECTQESLEISEKVLETIYGTVWQKDEVLPQSEPRRGRPRNLSKKKAPRTERKKHRTSIYEVFSSSSSEDRFEEFLENVHRGKLKSTLKIGNRPSTPDFINDSDESDCETSFTFYQNVLSSAVKDDIPQGTRSPKLNRRRLSFASSQEELSESGKPDLKEKKTSTKDRKKDNPKPRSKKKLDGVGKNSTDDDVIGFTLVTPIKVKDKKADNNNLDVRIKNLIENELPKSVGKTKTPKSNIEKDLSTEERLRAKYLNDGNFKVPKRLNSLKTPNKLTRIGTPSSPALSFLSSLSEVTAGLPCHPDSLIYKKNFKDKREELSKKLYSLYNREVFDNQLPADMVIEWSTRMRSTSGFCYNKRIYSNNQIFRTSRIVLSTKILDRADRLRDTLIHELCHAATWIVNATSDGHGPKWKAWADKANRRFPELPVIKRCHDYAISTKFTYKCMSCGYCIGRHSKSLNTDRKRCGYCYGKFQVFVTAKMSTASVTSGSDSVKTQRNPTGFALFVKENYASIKKENNVPHGQVMKLLSQKFAEVKISKQKEKEPVINV